MASLRLETLISITSIIIVFIVVIIVIMIINDHLLHGKQVIKELCSIIPDGDAAKRECDKVIILRMIILKMIILRMIILRMIMMRMIILRMIILRMIMMIIIQRGDRQERPSEDWGHRDQAVEGEHCRVEALL